ncbi:MAG: LEA type 2 family protein [Marinifilaceae bacterium]
MRPILYLFALLFITSCSTVKSGLKSAYNMTQCEYGYNSIADISVGGINFSNGVSLSDLPKAMAVLNSAKTNIPLKFTVNVSVKNPNSTAVDFTGMRYVLEADDIQLVNGSTQQTLNVAPGAVATLPVVVNFNVAQLLTSESGNAVMGIVRNIIGIGNSTSNVRMTLIPSFKVGERTIESPIQIPLSFTLGKK